MTLSTLVAALLYLGGIAAVIVGLRSFLSRTWSSHVDLRPPTDLRRAARVARIDDFRKRRSHRRVKRKISTGRPQQHSGTAVESRSKTRW